MKSSHLKGTIARVLLGFSLLFGIGIISSASVQAQYRDDGYRQDRRDRDYRNDQRRRDRDWRRDRNGRGRNDDGYGDYGGSFQLRQTALNAGANEGIKAGRKDRQHGERYEYRDEGAYQKATKDYSSRLGDRETYRQYFREAFEHAYADGYAGY